MCRKAWYHTENRCSPVPGIAYTWLSAQIFNFLVFQCVSFLYCLASCKWVMHLIPGPPQRKSPLKYQVITPTMFNWTVLKNNSQKQEFIVRREETKWSEVSKFTALKWNLSSIALFLNLMVNQLLTFSSYFMLCAYFTATCFRIIK